MNFQAAIDKHAAALLRIIAGLLVLAGVVEGKPVERMSWTKYSAILKILRPAESAVRRLIALAAAKLPIKLRTMAAASKTRTGRTALPAITDAADVQKRSGPARYSFVLFDPRQRDDEGGPRRWRGPEPRVWSLDTFMTERKPDRLTRHELSPDGMVGAKRLCRRLLAITQALQDIPKQVKRYVQWVNTPVEDRPPNKISVIRIGRPPWLPKRSTHEVHDILRECQMLLMNPPRRDTS